MSLSDIFGTPLSAVFAVGGERLTSLYALSGEKLWTAESAVFSGFTSSNISSHIWKFKRVSKVTDSSYSSVEEAGASYNDSAWESVTVPHDWSIYDDFNPSSPATYEGGYLDGGDAWYRTSFYANDDMLSQNAKLYFDGVYMEATVYLNGVKIAENYHGYSPFFADMSGTIKSGRNTIAVFVRNHQPSSRWYSGSGIYRPVYIVTAQKSPLSVSEICVTSPNLETEKDGGVSTHISFKAVNPDTAAKTCTVAAKICKDGQTAVLAQNSAEISCSAGESAQEIVVSMPSPDLWSVGVPNLYTVVLSVTCGNETYSSYPVTFGYRYFKFDVNTGFSLNGESMKLKGVCLHHDLGCIGAEDYRSAMERQIDIMTRMGANAIRLTHNPSSSDFLNLCMRKGVMLVEELFDMWTIGKNVQDFHRYFDAHYEEIIRNTLLRDRNNPAVIMWSLGNEINRTANYTSAQVEPLVTKLIAAVKKYDATRPTTMGEDRPTMDAAKTCMNLLDVCGINYNQNDLSIPHGLGKPSYGSETTSALSSRGVYKRDDSGYQCSSLDDDKVSWGSYAGVALKAQMESAYSAGMFVWTGFDYIGEPTPFNKFPTKSNYFGIVDLAGFPKDIYYMYQSRWTSEPMIHICPMDWTSWTAGENVTVILYSNCAKVELFLNGTSLGMKTQSDSDDRCRLVYTVPFASGALSAKGYDAGGTVVAEDIIKTAGAASKLLLEADNRNELIFVTCKVADANGVTVPLASNKVTFSAEGGTILGTDNGNAASVENMRGASRSAFNGMCLCVVKPNKDSGSMTIRGDSDGLESASIAIQMS